MNMEKETERVTQEISKENADDREKGFVLDEEQLESINAGMIMRRNKPGSIHDD